jgi:hypothetical protein
MAKCPKCERLIINVLLEKGPLGDQFAGPVLAGFVAVCPHCTPEFRARRNARNRARRIVRD